MLVEEYATAAVGAGAGVVVEPNTDPIENIPATWGDRLKPGIVFKAVPDDTVPVPPLGPGKMAGPVPPPPVADTAEPKEEVPPGPEGAGVFETPTPPAPTVTATGPVTGTLLAIATPPLLPPYPIP
jgi:hypothetical protein